MKSWKSGNDLIRMNVEVDVDLWICLTCALQTFLLNIFFLFPPQYNHRMQIVLSWGGFFTEKYSQHIQSHGSNHRKITTAEIIWSQTKEDLVA